MVEFSLHLLEASVGRSPHGVADEIVVFAVAREVQVEPTRFEWRCIASQVLRTQPISRHPAAGLDQIASRLSMNGIERSPNAVARQKRAAPRRQKAISMQMSFQMAARRGGR